MPCRVLVVWCFLAVSLSAQFTALLTLEGAVAGDQAGSAVASIGDVNGDGVGDILMGLPHAGITGIGAGQARVYSGATGGLLITIDGLNAGDLFGQAVCGIGDRNNDGFADFAVGAPLSDVMGTDSGSVRVFDGPAGALAFTLTGQVAFDNFGSSITGLGDVNADLLPDLAVGSPRADALGADFGVITVHEGVTGTILQTLTGIDPGDELGISIADAGDVNMDGVNDLIGGAHLADTQGPFSNSGRVIVWSGADWSVIHSLNGHAAVDLFGSSVAGIGDINADGHADFVIGARLADDGGIDSGAARVYSGIDATELFVFPGGAAGAELGTAVAGAGDFDGDGIGDIVLGAPRDDSAGVDAGRLLFQSGADGALLLAIDGAEAGATLGASVAGGFDFNLDGLDDVVAGSPLEDENGATDSGRARVYTFLDPAIILRLDGEMPGDQMGECIDSVGDVNGDSVEDFIVGIRLADPVGTSSGRAVLISGVDATILFAFDGEAAGDEFGTAVCGIGDVNGDNIPDVAVGAYAHDVTTANEGRVYVYSGFDGSLIYSLDGEANQDQFGFSLGDLGDINGDLVPDLIVGAPRRDVMSMVDAGKAYVFSGIDGSLIFGIDGLNATDQFGWSVDGAGDTNSDLVPDFIVGARLADGASSNSGNATVYSGADAAILVTHGGTAGEQFGYSVAGAGDVDGDGLSDVVIGGPLHAANSQVVGRVRIFSGATNLAIMTLIGSADGQNFGFSVDGAGDVNADGFADVIVGANLDDTTGMDAGAIYVYSGVDSSLVYTHLGEDANDNLGYDVIGAFDLNLDGFDDVAAGVRKDDDTGADAGGFRVLSLPNAPVHYPGTMEDLFLYTGLPGELDRVDDIKEFNVGENLLVNWRSLLATFDSVPPLLLGQFFTTGSPPVSPPGFPYVQVDPVGMFFFVVFDGSTGPFGPQMMPPGGLTLSFTIPAGLAGSSFIFQGVAASSLAANGILATTNAHEIRFL